jgi:hypothetical protein
MNNESEKKANNKDLYQRFEALLSGNSLSEEEKLFLSQEMLKIIYEGNGEVA